MPLLFDSSPPTSTGVWISVAAHAFDFELQAAVVEQQDVARLDVLRQILVVEADAFLVAELAVGVEDEAVADDQRDLAVVELADADLRALQVAEDADRAPEPLAAISRTAVARAM